MDIVQLGKDIMEIGHFSCDLATTHWDHKKHEGKGLYMRAALLGVGHPDMFALRSLCKGWIGGDKNSGNEIAYRAYSAEKLLRTAHNWFEDGDISASQSIDEGFGYIGAHVFRIRSSNIEPWREVLIASSGQEQEMDEGVNVAACHNLVNRGWVIDQSRLRDVLELSGNNMYRGSLVAQV